MCRNILFVARQLGRKVPRTPLRRSTPSTRNLSSCSVTRSPRTLTELAASTNQSTGVGCREDRQSAPALELVDGGSSETLLGLHALQLTLQEESFCVQGVGPSEQQCSERFATKLSRSEENIFCPVASDIPVRVYFACFVVCFPKAVRSFVTGFRPASYTYVEVWEWVVKRRVFHPFPRLLRMDFVLSWFLSMVNIRAKHPPVRRRYGAPPVRIARSLSEKKVIYLLRPSTTFPS